LKREAFKSRASPKKKGRIKKDPSHEREKEKQIAPSSHENQSFWGGKKEKRKETVPISWRGGRIKGGRGGPSSEVTRKKREIRSIFFLNLPWDQSK